MSAGAAIELITIGRSSVDLYGEQIGARLEDMSSFAKYLGGSPTNTAAGGARLGLSTALATRVGDDHMGRFIREELVREGVDVHAVKTDPDRLTALVVLGVRDRTRFPLIFYRENCADMALDVLDLDEAWIKAAGAVLVNGTHLSQPNVFEVCRTAAAWAKAAGRKVIFDIDYRPVLWGLTGRDQGDNRYVFNAEVTRRLQEVLPLCDLIVGTEEEFCILGGQSDVLAALGAVRASTPALLVCKRGAQGCVAFEGAVEDWTSGLEGPGFPVEVLNVLGAGDAFMAGFLRGWLRGEPLEVACRWANACGALVVSRHGCTPAMPTWDELAGFLARTPTPARPAEDVELSHLHWVGARRGVFEELMVLAIDHRAQFEELADQLHVPHSRIAVFKGLARRAMEAVAKGERGFGMLIDERYGFDELVAAADNAYWIGRPIEEPKSRPLAFEGGADVGLELARWPKGQVVKCLVFYHPDDAEAMRDAQDGQIVRLFESCRATGHELLLEIILPAGSRVGPDTAARAMRQIYALDVRPDWWKLEPSADPMVWANVETVIAEQDPHCRGVVMLGLSAPTEDLVAAFTVAAGFPRVKGFAVGRTIFYDAARDWMRGALDDLGAVSVMAKRFSTLVEAWRNAKRGVEQAA